MASQAERLKLIQQLMKECSTLELSQLSTTLSAILRIDFVERCPMDVNIKIFQYLDAKSLCHAAQCSRAWQRVADDDILWHRMCEQHIDKKCAKCGWGLPLLERKRKVDASQRSASDGQVAARPPKRTRSEGSAPPPARKVALAGPDAGPTAIAGAANGAATPVNGSAAAVAAGPSTVSDSEGERQISPTPSAPAVPKRRWKDIYSERLLVERNWRCNGHSTQEFRGHTDGVMCLQYDECFPLLVTGSYDNTVKIWNTETRECTGTLVGHTRCVRAVQFDDHKIISGSLDRTLRIWSMKTLECIRVLEGHNDGVACLHYDDKILASGSADSTIRIWNIATGKCVVLKGHTDWVNKVEIYNKSFLLSCSDDHSVRLWNIETRQAVRTFSGHHDQVQALHVSLPHLRNPLRASGIRTSEARLVTGSLDKTIKVWSLETGECLRTLFGHEGGVLSVAAGTLRIVSGSNDKKAIVWDLESGEQMFTLSDGKSQVNCCVLSDTKVVIGCEDGVIRLFDFGVPSVSI